MPISCRFCGVSAQATISRAGIGGGGVPKRDIPDDGSAGRGGDFFHLRHVSKFLSGVGGVVVGDHFGELQVEADYGF